VSGFNNKKEVGDDQTEGQVQVLRQVCDPRQKPAALSWGAEITLFIGLSLVLSPIGWGLIRGVMWLIHNHNAKNS